MGRIVHFEILADDPARAAKFYSDAFGWQVEKWKGPIEYWLVMTGPTDQPGIDGGIMQREGAPGSGAATAFVNTIDVADLDAAMAEVKRHGGAITDAKRAVPGVGWMCYANDTEGNRFGMMQSDTSAK
jgi:predicted enzyme related to lactoylglutathione lyase